MRWVLKQTLNTLSSDDVYMHRWTWSLLIQGMNNRNRKCIQNSMWILTVILFMLLCVEYRIRWYYTILCLMFSFVVSLCILINWLINAFMAWKRFPDYWPLWRELTFTIHHIINSWINLLRNVMHINRVDVSESIAIWGIGSHTNMIN